MTSTTQPITLNDELVAIVIADRAVLAAGVPARDVPIVERMCLIAMQIADGERPGPYQDAQAEREARHALTPHASRRCPPHIRSRGGTHHH